VLQCLKIDWWIAHKSVVLVMNGDKPDALMVGVESLKVLDAKGVRPAYWRKHWTNGSPPLSRRQPAHWFGAGERFALATASVWRRVDARPSASGRTQWDWSSANGIDTLVPGMHTPDQSDYLG
jgi:hypothetical protein